MFLFIGILLTNKHLKYKISLLYSGVKLWVLLWNLQTVESLIEVVTFSGLQMHLRIMQAKIFSLWFHALWVSSSYWHPSTWGRALLDIPVYYFDVIICNCKLYVGKLVFQELFARLLVLLHDPLAREQLATQILTVRTSFYQFYNYVTRIKKINNYCKIS